MIKILTILLLNFPIDKIYHFGAGCTISWTIGHQSKKPILGLYAGHTAGILKELRDYRKYQKADYKDALATTSGAFLIVWFYPKRFYAIR